MGSNSNGKRTVTLRHPVANAQALDAFVAREYIEFQRSNGRLLREKPVEYHAQAHRRVQERLMYFNKENEND